MTAAEQEAGGLRASDVVAFGQEYGRVLSDGRIVGRPEPFAKVFSSSRAVKRAVGVTAWAILEDIALDARLDVEGRLVADTNVRRIADNLGLATNTVAKHLGRLRDHGFVLHEEQRADDSGQYATSRYVLDPSACLERFTHTPAVNAARPTVDAEPGHSPVGNVGLVDRPESTTDAGFTRVPILATRSVPPCRKSCDTVICDTTTKTLLLKKRNNNRPVTSRDRRPWSPPARPQRPSSRPR